MSEAQPRTPGPALRGSKTLEDIVKMEFVVLKDGG